MAIFKIHAATQEGQAGVWYYDNITSDLRDEHGNPVFPEPETAGTPRKAFQTSKENPAGKETPRVLKISLGLMCNFECTYCSQRFVPRNSETGLGKIQEFMDNLDSWVTEEPERIEFWGGEPFAYIKVMKPLAEQLREKWANAEFVVITNGSLLNPEINQWLDEMGFSVGISHDGVGQFVRGPDPFADDKMKLGVFDLYRRLHPKGRISINSMLNVHNQSRAAINDYMVKMFGPDVNIGEGAFVDAYDDGGEAMSLESASTSLNYRSKSMQEALDNLDNNFGIKAEKVNDFMDSLVKRRDAYALGQKCAMDHPKNLAVDLNGNVLTCQNVSAVSTAPNGESHKIGHVSDFKNIKLKTATHWSQRPECVNCPVLQLCKGACMFLQGKLWDVTCNNSYSDNVVWFSLAFLMATGHLPYKIEHHDLPDIRQWLWQEPPRNQE